MQSQPATNPAQAPISRKIRVSRRARAVDLAKLRKRLLTVLAREVDFLMDQSAKHKLDKDDSIALTGYLKLLKELNKLDEDEGAKMTDEQLEKLAGLK